MCNAWGSAQERGAGDDLPADGSRRSGSDRSSVRQRIAHPEETAKELRPIPVQDVRVEIGDGSPTPVEVMVAARGPSCAPSWRRSTAHEGGRVEIELLATPPQPDCPPDQLGLPFRIAIPLNVVEMPGGTYSLAVNGVETAIDWDCMPALGASHPTLRAGDLIRLSVAEVRVEVGRGSPIPVEVVASGDWPDLCAQLAEMRQQINDDRIEISSWQRRPPGLPAG